MSPAPGAGMGPPMGGQVSLYFGGGADSNSPDPVVLNTQQFIGTQ